VYVIFTTLYCQQPPMTARWNIVTYDSVYHI